MIEKYTAEDIEVLTEIEHVLKKPGMWVGSIHEEKRDCWGISEGKLEKFTTKVNPAMHKIYREVLDNAIDELVLSKNKKGRIDVYLDSNNCTVRIRDNGRGIPIEKHPKEKKWTPELVLTQLRSGRNFGDNRGKTIGTYGVGVSLTNILSTHLRIKVQRDGQSYVQDFKDNSKKKTAPKVKKVKSKDSYTQIEFTPDDKIFKGSQYSIELIRRELVDLSYMFSNITFYLTYGNNARERIRGDSFSNYMKKISDKFVASEGESSKLGFYLREDVPLDQISMVNGAFTIEGGTHIEYILTWLGKLRPTIERKIKHKIKPNDIRSSLGIVCFMNMENPEFDSQTKSKLTSTDSKISPVLDTLTDKLQRKLMRSEVFTGMLDAILARCEAKENLKIKKVQKDLRGKKVAKLIDCHSKERDKCTLFITEGESARGYLSAVSDRDFIASLPLKGKILNCYDIKARKVLANEEIKGIMNSCGLILGEPKIDALRFGRIAIATDVDQDGNAILSLLINFFHRYWPDLFDKKIITRFVTPLYSVENKGKKKYFYTKKEFMQSNTQGNITYFKGLGSMSEEDWNYAVNTNPKYVPIIIDKETKDSLKLAFSSDSSARKQWLSK